MVTETVFCEKAIFYSLWICGRSYGHRICMLIGFQAQLQLVDGPDPALPNIHDKCAPLRLTGKSCMFVLLTGAVDPAPTALLSANPSNLAPFWPNTWVCLRGLDEHRLHQEITHAYSNKRSFSDTHCLSGTLLWYHTHIIFAVVFCSGGYCTHVFSAYSSVCAGYARGWNYEIMECGDVAQTPHKCNLFAVPSAKMLLNGWHFLVFAAD